MSSTSLPPEVPLDADAGRLIARAERLRCFVAAAQDQMNAAFLRAAAAIIHRHHCDANVFLVNYESPRRVLGWSPASAADVLAHGFDPDEPEACKALRAMQMPFADLASVDNLVDETRGCLTSVAAAEWVELHYAQDLYAVDIDRALQDPAPPLMEVLRVSDEEFDTKYLLGGIPVPAALVRGLRIDPTRDLHAFYAAHDVPMSVAYRSLIRSAYRDMADGGSA